MRDPELVSEPGSGGVIACCVELISHTSSLGHNSDDRRASRGHSSRELMTPDLEGHRSARSAINSIHELALRDQESAILARSQGIFLVIDLRKYMPQDVFL
ncbi:Nck-associated protein [Dorcoceras hygrometricum]|uniref:Nck-associated protein n=1 Tax=Dorcoceras hygrometricum TaxID=472368 RepID=A0A2Z7CFE5_9LAMI|nr:Nck-associated protein [Dorcoceras hygrometricum]